MDECDSTLKKICTKCYAEKSLELFQKRKEAKDGRRGACKDCDRSRMAVASKKYKEKNTEKVKASYKEWAENNKENLQQRAKKYSHANAAELAKKRHDEYWANPEKYRTKQKEWAKANPEARKIAYNKWSSKNSEYLAENKAKYQIANKEDIAKKTKLRYQSNPEKYKARARNWASANKLLVSEMRREWAAKNRARTREYALSYYHKMKDDALFASKLRARSAVNSAFRRMGYTKKTRTYAVLGCDWESFKTHIERQFIKGMTWGNRGEWHIDHIQPLSAAKTEADVISLTHFTNLRPMWAADNLAKSDKITHLI
jgi:hypothetical protein